MNAWGGFIGIHTLNHGTVVRRRYLGENEFLTLASMVAGREPSDTFITDLKVCMFDAAKRVKHRQAGENRNDSSVASTESDEMLLLTVDALRECSDAVEGIRNHVRHIPKYEMERDLDEVIQLCHAVGDSVLVRKPAIRFPLTHNVRFLSGTFLCRLRLR